MPSLRSILPFWRQPVSPGEAAPAPIPAKPEDFGKASSFELLFDRLMDDPDARRDTLFPTRSCR
ncbi:MAG: hypothetical protein AB7F09_13810 [Parvibaculaceae bacterium]